MKPGSRSDASAVSVDSPRDAPALRWVLLSLSLATALSALGTSIANVALPTLMRTFQANFQTVQWVVLAYLLAVTTVIVSVGRFGDIVGRRRLLLAGLLLFTVASMLCGAAGTLWLLIGARAVQGLGAAIMMAMTMALVGETVPKARTGSAMGLLGTMSAIGTALGPTLGGALIAGLGWRSLFILTAPLGLLASALVWRHVPADRRAVTLDRSGFDAVGTLLLASTMGAYALAMTTGRGSFGPTNLALLIVASVSGGLFLLTEARVKAPLLQLTMFRNRLLRSGFAMSVLVTTVVMATLIVGPFYLSGALALDAAHVGLVMSSGPIVAALTGAPAGRLVDRLDAHTVTIGGLVAMALGCASLALLPVRFGIAGYAAPLVIVTAGYAMFQAANNTAVMSAIRSEQRGVISGMLNLSRNIGLITGASVMGSVYALGTQLVRDSGDGLPVLAAATGMHLTFAVATVLIVGAIAIAFADRVRAASAAAGA